MAQIELPNVPQAVAEAGASFLHRYHDDPAFAEKLRAHPAETLRENGVAVAEGIEVKLIEASYEGPYHIIFPTDPNSELSDELLKQVSGGAATAGTAGTASTISTLTTCLGSLGTAGTAGSAS